MSVLSVHNLELEFLAAVRQGSSEITSFNTRYAELLQSLEGATAVPESVQLLAQSTSSLILAQASLLRDYTSDVDDLVDEFIHPLDDNASANQSAAAPLFRYLLDNICYPYPDSEEKERLVEESREAGWRDFDRKKCEDWLNRKRHQSGYVSIARKYCDEDSDAMRFLCHAVLFGSADQKARVHPAAVEEVEDMYELLEAQYEDLVDDHESAWVEDLTSGVLAVVGNTLADDSTSVSLSSDDVYSDDSDDDRDSDSSASAADVDSDSDADDEDEIDHHDVPLPPVIGAKRKIAEFSVFSAPRLRVARMPSLASSATSSSDSASSSASFRSFSGSSVSSATSYSLEDNDDEYERPAKRTRSESFSPEPECAPSPTSDSRTTLDLWAMRASAALSKRKRDDDDLETRTRNMKRSRYAALSAAAPSNIPAQHLSPFTDICNRSWSCVVPFDVLGYSVDSELYTVDCTAMQTADDDDDDSDVEQDEDNNFADIIGLCNDPDAPDDATWATVQLHALAQTLTGSRLPMSAELCADTVEVKLEELSPQELSSLGETLATTPESITTEYPLDQSLLLEDDDAFSPPELSDGESSGTSSPDRSPSPPVELESSPERLIADYAMSTRTRKELDTLQHPWFAQMFGQQGLSFFDPNTFRVECNPPPGMMAQESHPDFLAQLDL